MKSQLFKYLIAGAILFLSFGSKAFSEVSSEPIKLGSILILTGEGASWGTSARNGMELAIEKLNLKGGVLGKKLVAVHHDDQGDPKTTISAFRELTDLEDIHFIIGPSWSNLAIPLMDMARSSKTILISPSIGITTFTQANKFLFSTWPRDVQLSSDLADYVFSKGYKAVALIGAEHVWVREQTNSFRARFEKIGGKILFQAEPIPGTVDVRSYALKIQHTPGIEAVVSTTDGVIVGSLIAKALKDLNVHLPLFSIALDQSAIDASQGGFEGLEFMTYHTPTSVFKAEYENRFHVPVDAAADTAYDAVMLLAQAIEESGSTDAELVAERLAGIKHHEGASGHLVSDGIRGFKKQNAIRKVINGKPQVFENLKESVPSHH